MSSHATSLTVRPLPGGALRQLTAALSVALATIVLAGCGDSSPREGYRLAVIPKGTTHTFWDYIHAGALKGASELEAERGTAVEIIWDGPIAENARNSQINIVENFIGQNVDGIVLAPLDDQALVAPVAKAMLNGKPVVIIDSGLKGENYVSFVATDNYQGGQLGARRVGELLGGKGKALLLRYMVGSASTTEREQGFIDVMKEDFPDVELLPEGLEQYAGATMGEAQDVSETLLNTYQDIEAIFCPNESSATGMLEALKKSGRAGKIKFVGFDASEKLVQGMEQGFVHGLILQDPVGMAARGVKTLVDHLEGKKVDKKIDTGVFLVTPENMRTPQMQALLKPDISILGK